MRLAGKISSRRPLQARSRACRVTLFALLVLVALAASVEAKVAFQNIEVEGRGKTVASATTDALKRAVQRVNGRSIQAEEVVQNTASIAASSTSSTPTRSTRFPAA